MYVGGDQMEGGHSVALPGDGTVAPGQEVDVSVDLVSPPEYGRYVGYWRLVTPENRKFGQRVWVNIQSADVTAPPVVPEDSADSSDSGFVHMQHGDEGANDEDGNEQLEAGGFVVN